ncbi:hypothetical protein [Reichenbachiella ulvae]|uniref:Uncharacterized protein n=1 Tax=Reichenbachiella ulvae TaxID=2980104 RepID=A0ABT3CUK4_9BACT|nr:hypothetical protein [Reichenbachiella ulvae]MCV9387381.1 hypothetical protein [Reichenbachiella ulvae]
MKKIWTFLNSNFFLLILGFGLTTIAGTYISDRVQQKSWLKQAEFEKERQLAEWKREKRFEILRRKLDNGQAALEELSDLINLRFYRLQNVYINIVQKDLNTANKNWGKYFETVEDWNVKLTINQNKIRRLVNDEESYYFNNYETDNPDLEQPESIHGKFYVAHQKVLNLLRCLRNSNCTITKQQKKEVNELLRELDYQTDNFVDRISDIYLRQTTDLENFK